MPITEKKRQYLKEYRKKNKEYISKMAKGRYDKNRETRIKQSRDWQDKNMGRVIELHKGYYKKNPERYRVRMRTVRKYKHLLKGGVCEICKIEDKLQFHHTTEPYEVDKFMIVCVGCHRQIHAKFGKFKKYDALDKQGEGE